MYCNIYERKMTVAACLGNQNVGKLQCKNCPVGDDVREGKITDDDGSQEQPIGMQEAPPTSFKKCSSCGKKKDFDFFSDNKKTKDGKCYSCKACDKERGKKRRADKKTGGKRGPYKDREKKPEVKPVAQTEPPRSGQLYRPDLAEVHMEPFPKNLSITLTLNFSDHPDLYDLLVKEAKDNFRAPNGQAMWIVVEYLKMVEEEG